jgi:hypothetical protein
MLNSAAVSRTDLQTNERPKTGGLAAPLCFLESQPPVDESSTKTDIGQQVAQDTQQILKDYLNS